MKPILQTKKKPQLNVASLFARLNYFLAGASAAGAGAAFLSAAGAALLSAGFTAALGSAAGLSAAIAVNEINAVITNANIFFIYDPCKLKLSWGGQLCTLYSTYITYMWQEFICCQWHTEYCKNLLYNSHRFISLLN